MSSPVPMRGFTLVEVVVAIGIFAIASTLVTTSFLSLLDARRNIEAKQQVYDEFRLISEHLSREVSVAKKLQPVNCTGGACTELRMVTTTREEYSPRLIVYKLLDGRILKAEQRDFGACMERIDEGGGTATLPAECFVPMTSSNLSLDRVDFSILNNDTVTTKPLVVFTVKGTVAAGPTTGQPFTFSRNITTQPLNSSDDNIGADDRPPVLTVTNDQVHANATVELEGTAEDSDTVVVIGVYNLDLYEVIGGSDPKHFLIYKQGGGGTGTYDGTSDWTINNVPLNPGIENHLLFYAADSNYNTSTLPYLVDATGLTPVVPPKFDLNVTVWCNHLNDPGQRINVAENGPSPHEVSMPWRLYRCETVENSPCSPRSDANLVLTRATPMTNGLYDGFFRDDTMKNPSYVFPKTMLCYSARYWSPLHNVYGPWADDTCAIANPLLSDNCASTGGSSSGSSSGGGDDDDDDTGSSSGATSSGRPPRTGGGGTE